MEDFLTLIDLIIQKDVPSGKFNVSTGTSHSILELFHAVRDYLE